MVFNGASLDAYQASGASPLAMLEKKQRTFLGISWGEIKLLAIAGVGCELAKPAAAVWTKEAWS